MKLVIYVNEDFEEQRTLYDLENNKVIMTGDWYHDKIDHKIEGYLEALKEFNIYNEEVEDYWIGVDHPHYKLADLHI